MILFYIMTTSKVSNKEH